LDAGNGKLGVSERSWERLAERLASWNVSRDAGRDAWSGNWTPTTVLGVWRVHQVGGSAELLENVPGRHELQPSVSGHLDSRALEGGPQPFLHEAVERFSRLPHIDDSRASVSRPLNVKDLASRRTVGQAQILQDRIALFAGHCWDIEDEPDSHSDSPAVLRSTPNW
jgi:hypothetical protein